MSGATAGGLPYPTGTDKVRDGDNAIQALADALQLRGHGLRILAGVLNSDALSGGYTWYRFGSGSDVGAVLAASVTCHVTGGNGLTFSIDRFLTAPVMVGGKLFLANGSVPGDGGIVPASVIVIGTMP